MAIYFLSDFHLGEGDRPSEARKLRLFEKFLELHLDDMEHLVVLGDLFDFWFEYRHLIPKHHLHILFRLAELVKAGIRVSYIAGNHDHWMGNFLSSELGITIIRAKLEIETDAGKILAMHGDGLAKSDRGYRVLKKILRNRFCVGLYKLLPPNLAYWLAHGAARSSRLHNSQRPSDGFRREYREFAVQKLREGYFAFICGHTHYPELEKIDDSYYVNSGDWITHFSYVRFSEGKFELASLADTA